MAAALWRAEAACGVLVADTVKRYAGRVASFKTGGQRGTPASRGAGRLSREHDQWGCRVRAATASGRWRQLHGCGGVARAGCGHRVVHHLSPPATVECVVWPGGGGSEDDGNRGAPVAAPVMSLAMSWVHPAALPKWPLRALDLHSVPACGARLPPRHHLRLAVYLSPLSPSGAAPTPPPPAMLLPYGNPRVQLVATPTICRLPLAR